MILNLSNWTTSHVHLSKDTFSPNNVSEIVKYCQKVRVISEIKDEIDSKQ